MDRAILKTLGRRIRERRRAVGLSQEELCHRAGIDRSYISGVERGVRNPTFTVLSQIARALDCRVADLFAETGEDAEQSQQREVAWRARRS